MGDGEIPVSTPHKRSIFNLSMMNPGSALSYPGTRRARKESTRGASTSMIQLLLPMLLILLSHTSPRYRTGVTTVTHGDTGKALTLSKISIPLTWFRDNIYGGKLMRYERQIHHYGSGLNALPLISQFMSDPSDIYLLRVGFGGLSGPLSNIDEGGFASASFHSFADTLKWDAYSGDYGPNFVGHALNSGAYLIQHSSFGWQVFGGRLTKASSTSVQVQVLDSVRRRIFVAPTGTLFTLDAGAFSAFTFDPRSKSVTLTILPAPQNAANAASAPRARIVVSQTTNTVSNMVPTTTLQQDAGAWVAPFISGKAMVTFAAH